MLFSVIKNFLASTKVRIAVIAAVILLLGAGTAIFMITKDQQAICRGDACKETARDSSSPLPNDRESSSESPEATTSEEQKKKEEEKKQPNTNPSGSNGQQNGGANTPSSTTPPSDSGDTAPGNQGRSCPAYPAFPDTTCTGVPAGVSLASVSSLSTTSTGQTIDGMLINGDLNINHNNVTVTNSRIKGRVVYNNHRGLTLQDVDLGADSCPASSNGGNRLIAGDDYTLTRVHAHHNGADLIALAGGGTITIQDSLVTSTCYYAGDHLDAIQYYDPGSVANVTISHNTIDARPVNGGGFGNAAIFWADFPGAGSRLNVYNNFMAGGNYTLYALDATSGSGVVIDVSGNRFLRNQYNYGPCSLSNSDPFNGTSGIKWSNNAYSDGAAISIDDC